MPKHTKTKKQPPHRLPLSVMLEELERVDLANPFVMAAFMDWCRQVWKGDPKELAKAGWIAQAVEWIEERADRTAAEQFKYAARDYLRAAVAS